GSTPLPWETPYSANNALDPRNDPNSPFYDPSYETRNGANNFAFGGAASTMGNGIRYGLVAYDNLINDIAHQIVDETKGLVK
ncbi:MAG TPA: hypothetical protein VFU15_09975, partial [Bacteroidia bacterium]|nr:hypothetical protein [Bacteroidia bacterium]